MKTGKKTILKMQCMEIMNVNDHIPQSGSSWGIHSCGTWEVKSAAARISELASLAPQATFTAGPERGSQLEPFSSIANQKSTIKNELDTCPSVSIRGSSSESEIKNQQWRLESEPSFLFAICVPF